MYSKDGFIYGDITEVKFMNQKLGIKSPAKRSITYRAPSGGIVVLSNHAGSEDEATDLNPEERLSYLFASELVELDNWVEAEHWLRRAGFTLVEPE